MLFSSTYMNIVLSQKLKSQIDNLTFLNRNRIEKQYRTAEYSYDLGFECGITTFASTVTADCWYHGKSPTEAKVLRKIRLENIDEEHIIKFRFKDGWLDGIKKK